jgi:hypothetical protein
MDWGINDYHDRHTDTLRFYTDNEIREYTITKTASSWGTVYSVTIKSDCLLAHILRRLPYVRWVSFRTSGAKLYTTFSSYINIGAIITAMENSKCESLDAAAELINEFRDENTARSAVLLYEVSLK